MYEKIIREHLVEHSICMKRDNKSSWKRVIHKVVLFVHAITSNMSSGNQALVFWQFFLIISYFFKVNISAKTGFPHKLLKLIRSLENRLLYEGKLITVNTVVNCCSAFLRGIHFAHMFMAFVYSNCYDRSVLYVYWIFYIFD